MRSGACLASQDSRATHRGTLLSELSAHGHAATFEPRTLAANLGGMCDDTGGGGVSLLRAGLCGGNVRHGLACGSVPHRTPTEPPDGSKDGGCSSTHQKTGATTPRLAVTRRTRAGLPRARAAPKMRSAPALSLGYQVASPPSSEQRRLCELHQAWFGPATPWPQQRMRRRGGDDKQRVTPSPSPLK